MSRVTVLGMGAMGSRMAANLIEAGNEVTVWNRNPDRATPLVEAGAATASTPAEAASAADVVISIVRDDGASRAVWLDPDNGALAGMPKNAIAVESSTLTVEWARELGEHFESSGVAFLDAPVAGSRPQAEAAQLIFLVGGDPEVLDRVRPLLETMGGGVHHAGPVGSGVAVKLMVNALFGIQVAAIGELIGFARGSGLDVDKAMEILTAGPVCSPAAKMAAGAMLAGKFDPLFPIELVEKDFSYVAQTAKAGGASVPISEAAGRVYAEAVDEGYGDLNITGIAKRYFFIGTLLFFLAAIANLSTAQSFWEPTGGPPGGFVNALMADNGTIYAGTYYGGMFKSTNLGESWSRLEVTQTFERVVGFASNSQSHLFAASTKGVRRSTDGGVTWDLFKEGISNPNVQSIAINSTDVLFAGTSNAGIFRSEDNGETWVEVNNGLTELSVLSVTIGPAGIVYSGTSSGVFMSKDNGDNWTDISAGLSPQRIWSVFVDANGVLWAATFSGTYMKPNPAADFERTNIRRASIVIDTSATGTLLVGGDVILRSIDGGAEWTENPIEPGVYLRAHDFASTGGALLVATNSRGIFRSDDDGVTWQITNNGLDASGVTSLASDQGDFLFAGTGQGVFRSGDRGTTWERLIEDLDVGNIEVVFVTSARLVLAGTNNDGIYSSSDSGVNWSRADSNLTGKILSLAEAPNGDLFAGGRNETVFRSTNGGASWDTVDTGPGSSAVLGLGVSPAGVVFAGSNDKVRRSTDGGETWEDANTGLPSNLRAKGFEFLPNGDVVAATFPGVFRSSDDGDSWVKTGSVPIAGLLDIKRGSDGKLYIAVRGGGVAVSEDDAATWTTIREGLNNLNVTSIAIVSHAGKSGPSTADEVFVGTLGGGVSRLESTTTGVRHEKPDVAASIHLSANYPNPFRTETTFRIDLDQATSVSATVFDILGREVYRLEEWRLPAGESTVRLDGRKLPTGTYLFQLDVGHTSETRLITIAR